MATPTDKQVEKDNYQAFDDTCFERSVTEAMELSGWLLGKDAPAFALDLYQKIYPGGDPNNGGTYMSDALRGLQLATSGQVAGAWVYGADDVLAALNDGAYCVLGEHNLMGDNENHFLLFLPGRGDNPQGIHCIDSDEAIDYDPDVWPLAQVVAAGQDLMGPGQPIGITFKLEDKTVATPTNPPTDQPATPADPIDPAVQAALDKMLADQNAVMTDMWTRFRQGKFEGADGVDGGIVQLQGGQPLNFTPSYPPKA